MVSTARLAHMSKLAGHDGGDGMARALALEERIGAPPLGGGARAWRAKQLLWDGDLPGARGAVERLLADESIPNRELERPYRLYDLALLECAAGNFAAAQGHVDRGVQAAVDADNVDAGGWLLFPTALVGAWIGDEPGTVTAARRLIDRVGRPRGLPAEARARYVLGLLALSKGDNGHAASELARSVALLYDWGVAHPGAVPSLPAAVEALAAAGRLTEAAALLDRLACQVARVDTPWGRSALAYARGTLRAVTSQLDEGVQLLEASASGFARLGCRPDRARALLLAGRALLQIGRKTAACERLVEARELFRVMGAALWEARAVEDLQRAAPGRASGTLTQTERRIAVLVTQGLKNKEIAHTAFMSVATVEAHLTRMYRKLGIRSRTQLARLVTGGSIAGLQWPTAPSQPR